MCLPHTLDRARSISISQEPRFSSDTADPLARIKARWKIESLPSGGGITCSGRIRTQVTYGSRNSAVPREISRKEGGAGRDLILPRAVIERIILSPSASYKSETGSFGRALPL